MRFDEKNVYLFEYIYVEIFFFFFQLLVRGSEEYNDC